MRWPGTGPRLEVDQPMPGARLSGTVEVAGWRLPRGAAIARVEAGLAGGAASPLDYGLPRPDVAARHGGDPACGFSGSLSLASVPSGPLTLVVMATDARGRRAARRLQVTRCDDRAESAESWIEVERAIRGGEWLEIEGLAVAPPGGRWRSLRVEVDGVAVGGACFGLSRPDLAGRAGWRREVVRGGFRFRGLVPAGERVELVAEAASGFALRHPLARPLESVETRPVRELSELLEHLAAALGREPTLLNASGRDLEALLPGSLVVTPLDGTILPYADRSFDVVVLSHGNGERLNAARRLACHAVVRAGEAGVETLWRGEACSRRYATVSIVIPVHNQSTRTEDCLLAVQATWPAGVEGEVLLVDDGSTDDTPQRAPRWAERNPRLRILRLTENRGFIAACNAGAAAATGQVLVFLNNDTVPQRGWLPPLLSTLEREHAGAVGGKLLYPDGSLQEAGGVIFADGEGCNFGRGDAEPDHPLFAHVREVDYCSGALLATPRALFQRLGGFDPAYAPAYYEDTDYAFHLRDSGYRVYYQPESVVVHVEGATGGRDPTAGVKRQQPLNRQTFTARWAAALASQPLPPPAIDRSALHELRVRGPRGRRALVVVPTMPEPDRESGSRRAFHMIELLAEAGWSPSVVVENATGGERCARALRQLGAAVYAGPDTRGAGSDYLDDLGGLLALERFDLALLAFWHVAERHLPLLRARSPHSRVLVDSVDLHFLREARCAFGAATRGLAALDLAFADRLRRELNVYGGADGVLTVSEKEAAWVDDILCAPGHAHCVPDLEDSSAAPPPRNERRGLVFLGNFRHRPNVDALRLLAEVVDRLDLGLLAAHPLSIVGNALEPGMLGSLTGHPHVHAVGWVPAVEPYLAQALVSLVPLRQGAGTKRKILQSLLAGTPCVSTTLGIEGLSLRDGFEVAVADQAGAFAAAVSRLVHDEESWTRQAERGRLAMARSHGRDVVRSLFLAALLGG